MAVNRVCDCGCEQPMGEYDAGATPLVLRVKAGIEVVVTVVPKDGIAPNVRPACIGRMLNDAEMLYPPRRPVLKAGKVVDPEAAETDEEREAHHPVPLRATS